MPQGTRVVRMNKEVALLTAMRRLRVEEHVHLDELNPQAPSPGQGLGYRSLNRWWTTWRMWMVAGW